MADQAHFMSAAKPLYSLGDLVAFYWEIDEVLQYGLAYITGVEYKPEHTHEETWWYAVRVLTPIEVTNYDQMPEDEIIGRVIHGT